MMNKPYTPMPINTADVAIPEDIAALATLLARNTHDVWAANRIAQGWTWGEARNDTLKQTPCLVDFDDLTDEERAYDYDTSLETIKVMLKLGYRILPPEKA